MKQLQRAIEQRRQIRFRYKKDTHPRIVEPHVLGYQNGNLILRGYQNEKGWRSFFVNEIRDHETTSLTFDGPRGTGDPSRWESIVAVVTPHQEKKCPLPSRPVPVVTPPTNVLVVDATTVPTTATASRSLVRRLWSWFMSFFR